MRINETIKNFRKSKGFNQYALAEATGVSVDTVRRWEKGTQVPRADELVHLAEALGCSEADLQSFTGHDLRMGQQKYFAVRNFIRRTSDAMETQRSRSKARGK